MLKKKVINGIKLILKPVVNVYSFLYNSKCRE